MNQNQYPYPYGNQQTPTQDGFATASLVLGLIALISNFINAFWLSLILGPLALIFASKSQKALGEICGTAKAGRICGIIGLILGIARIAIVVIGVLLYVLLIFLYIYAIGASLAGMAGMM